ncbi:MAG: hypothetical protein AB8V03_05570 [Francisella endosymbiont of Hyalomma asiaticum]
MVVQKYIQIYTGFLENENDIKPLITVITVVYNGEADLEKTIL